MLLLTFSRAWTQQKRLFKLDTVLCLVHKDHMAAHGEDSVHAKLQEMNNELKRQERVLDAVTDHTDRSAYELQNVSQQAKKDFRVRPGAHQAFSFPPSH